MQFLYNLTDWLAETRFYKDFLSSMPAPLDNIYFDTVLLAILILYGIYRIIDAVQASNRHRAIRRRQDELKEKQAENEINAINREKEARSQREDMNQFMRYMETAMMASSVSAITGGNHTMSFDEFKATESKKKITDNKDATTNAFDTVDEVSPTTAPADTAEIERLSEELKQVREAKSKMEADFNEKQKLAQAKIIAIQAEKESTEAEAQAEIDKLKSAVETEKNNYIAFQKETTDKMAQFEQQKAAEIANLTAQLDTSTGDEHEEQLAKIEALQKQLADVKQEAENELKAKEAEITRIQQENDSKIADITDELNNVKAEKEDSIAKLSDELDTVKGEKQALINEYDTKMNDLALAKDDEVAAIQQKLAELSVQYEKDTNSRQEEINRLQEQLNASYNNDEAAKQLKEQLEAAMAEKESLVARNTEEINRVRAELDSVKKEKAAEVNSLSEQLANLSNDEAKKLADAQDKLIAARNQIDSMKADYDSQIANLTAQIDAANSDNTTDKEARDSKIAELTAEIGRITSERDGASAKAKSEIEKLTAHVADVEREKSLMEDRVKDIEAQKEAEIKAMKDRIAQLEKNEATRKEQIKSAVANKISEGADQKAVENVFAKLNDANTKVTKDEQAEKEALKANIREAEKAVDNPMDVLTKPVAKPIFAFGGNTTSTDNEFAKMLNVLNNTNAKAEAVREEEARKDAMAADKKRDLSEKLEVEAEDEIVEEKHTLDEATENAIEAQKQRALAAEKKEKNKKKGFFW